MAENHPVGFQWVMEARERGATIIHVDPRFTRTSATADIWVPLRAGTDILFLGGIINYVLQNDKYFHDYVLHYTNAAMLVREDFRDTEDLGGLFSGWDKEKQKYSPETWLYQGEDRKKLDAKEVEEAGHQEAGGGHGKDRGGEAGKVSDYKSDPTLQDPHCVFQILKRHFSRYTPEMVEQHAGVPKKLFLKVAEALCNASGPEKTAAMCYAVGWTQHSKGVQIIRSAAILQMLLGNIGRPGGGILALRGHASIQGSTDIPTLYDILPGYLPMPFKEGAGDDLDDYLKKHTADAGLWNNFPSYFISLMKAWYGDNATKENNWGFNYLPRVTGDHSHFGYWLEMADGKMDGLFIMGQNPAVGAPNARLATFRHGQAEMARRARHGGNRERVLVVQLARGGAWRIASSRHRHRSLPLPRLWFRREGGQPDQHPATGAIPAPGGPSAGRCAQRELVHASSGTAAKGESRCRSQPAQRRHECVAMAAMARTASMPSRTLARF